MKTYFIIISVIDFPNKKLSYSPIRSIYSKEERLIQTKQSVESILQYSPESEITLLEIGLTDYKKEFSDFNNKIQYTYVGNNKIIKQAVQSKFKALGEVFAMFYILLYLVRDPKALYFKLSGRYALNKNFQRVQWHGNRFNFNEKEKMYSTRLYGFPGGYKFFLFFVLLISLPIVLLNLSIEKILNILIPRRYIFLQDTIGISGSIGINKHPIDE